MNTRTDYTRLGRTLVAAATLSVLLLFVAVPRSQADDRAQCQQRTEQAEARLQQEIREHGQNSPQVENLRREINVERERCWNQHQGWWSGDDRQWHNERNWDRDRGQDSRAQCQQRTEQAEARLQQEIREHGQNSPQVENLRREINVERERCWNQHQGWWSGDDRQWHNERNWSPWLGNRSYQAGYQDGLRIGRQEQASGRGYKNPGDYKLYKRGDQAYRNGFWTGYRLAFGIQQ